MHKSTVQGGNLAWFASPSLTPSHRGDASRCLVWAGVKHQLHARSDQGRIQHCSGEEAWSQIGAPWVISGAMIHERLKAVFYLKAVNLHRHSRKALPWRRRGCRHGGRPLDPPVLQGEGEGRGRVNSAAESGRDFLLTRSICTLRSLNLTSLFQVT